MYLKDLSPIFCIYLFFSTIQISIHTRTVFQILFLQCYHHRCICIVYRHEFFFRRKTEEKKTDKKQTNFTCIWRKLATTHIFTLTNTYFVSMMSKNTKKYTKKNNKINWKVRLVNVTFLIWVALCRYSGRDTAGAMQTPVILSVNTFSI